MACYNAWQIGVQHDTSGIISVYSTLVDHWVDLGYLYMSA